MGANAYVAPPRLTAADVIDGEFEDTLSAEIRREVAEALPGYWTWREDPRTVEEIERDLLVRLREFQAILIGLDPAHGKLGHNQPPEELPFTQVEHAVATVAVERVIADVEDGGKQAADLALLTWEGHSELWGKFGKWVLNLVNVFATTATEAFAKRLPDLIIAGGAIGTLHEIAHLLELLVQAL